MISARMLIRMTLVAVAAAVFGVGCATSASRSTGVTAHQAAACDGCVIAVIDQVPLPASTDQLVVHQADTWAIIEHSCSHCEQPAARYVAMAGFQDPCLTTGDEGVCCTEQTGHDGHELAQVAR